MAVLGGFAEGVGLGGFAEGVGLGDFAEGVGLGAFVVTAGEEQFADSAALLGRRFGDLAEVGGASK